MKKTPMIFRWAIIGLTVGPLCGYVVVIFKDIATASGTVLYTQVSEWYYVLPFGGALVVALLYVFVPGASGEGMPNYVETIRAGNRRFSARVTIAKFFSAAIVLASGGSGGMVGPVSRVTGGIGQEFGALLNRVGFEREVVRRAAVCGASAGVSAILGAPVAGALFAVEILYADGINYEDVFPALLASASSFLVVYTRPGYEPFLGTLRQSGGINLTYLPEIVVLAVVATGVGIVFCRFFSVVRDWMTRHVRTLSIRCLFGAAAVVVSAVVFGRTVLGPGTDFIKDVVQGGLPAVRGSSLAGEAGVRIAGFLLLLALGKMLATTFTIGSGLSAGLTYPSILMGACVGAAGARLAGLDPATNPETCYAFVACGVSALLASVMNIPLTAAILVTELFGLNQSVPGIIGSVAAYSLARHVVIYRYNTP
jgi:CIC family chloride channel protein